MEMIRNSFRGKKRRTSVPGADPHKIHALDSPLQGRPLSSKLNVAGYSAQIEFLAFSKKDWSVVIQRGSAVNARREKPSLGYIS